MTLTEIVDHLPVGELTNTDESTFWWTSRKFEKRFKHEKAKVGSTFYDGNNGDKWKVLAINLTYERIIVENLSQGGKRLLFWPRVMTA